MSLCAGPCGIRPRDGLSPIRPQQAAGIRIEPAPSVACAIGTIPEPTAAAAPPDDPPALKSLLRGFRVGPNAPGSVVTLNPSSGRLVLPMICSPAALKRVVNSSS